MKPRCPACNSKQVTPWKQGMLVCHNCKGRWSEAGMNEGGDYDDRRPDVRLMREESGGPGGYAIRQAMSLKGGLK